VVQSTMRRSWAANTDLRLPRTGGRIEEPVLSALTAPDPHHSADGTAHPTADKAPGCGAERVEGPFPAPRPAGVPGAVSGLPSAARSAVTGVLPPSGPPRRSAGHRGHRRLRPRGCGTGGAPVAHRPAGRSDGTPRRDLPRRSRPPQVSQTPLRRPGAAPRRPVGARETPKEGRGPLTAGRVAPGRRPGGGRRTPRGGAREEAGRRPKVGRDPTPADLRVRSQTCPP
jgi:hypothetical protein